MTKKEDVKRFLQEFKVKMRIFSIIFRDNRAKNTKSLLSLDISPNERKEIIRNLEVEDYYEGPLDDNLYGIASMWVFGKNVKKKEVYIKISIGINDSSVICISFHEAEHSLSYPFKI